MDCIPKNRKDATREREYQGIYYTLICTFSRRGKRDEKLKLSRGLIIKSKQYDSEKLDNSLFENVPDIRQSHKVYRKKNMENLRVELTAGGKSLAKVKIQGVMFQGDKLSSLLFIIAIMPHNHIRRKCTVGFRLHKL